MYHLLIEGDKGIQNSWADVVGKEVEEEPVLKSDLVCTGSGNL